MCKAAVGGGVHDLAEVDVAGGGQHVDAVEAALGVGPSGDAIPIVGENLLHDIVRIVVVVAVFGRLVGDEVIDAVIALEVMIHGLHQFFHGEVMVIEAVVLDGGQAVGYGAYADALNVVGVVPCAARVVVLALLDAVVGQYGEEGSGHVLGEYLLDYVAAGDLDIHEVLYLLLVSLKELLIAVEVLGKAGVQAQLMAAHVIVAIVQGELKYLGQVEVALKYVGLVAEGAGLYAAGGAAHAGVVQGLAGVHQLGYYGLGVVEGRLAPALAGYLAGALEELAGGLAAYLHVAGGLEQLHFVHAVQYHVADLVYAVLAVLGYAAGVDVGEVRIGAALLEGDADLWGSGLVVKLDPQALQKLQRTVPVNAAVLHVVDIEGIKVLIQTSRRVSVPGIELAGNAYMHEPVLLYCLPEGPGLMGGYPAAVFRYLKELCFALLVGLLRGHLLCQIGVAVGKDYDSVAVYGHCVELAALFVCFLVVEEIQPGYGVLDVLFVIEEALFEYLAGAYGMTGAALLHEFGEYAGLIGQLPFGSHGL